MWPVRCAGVQWHRDRASFVIANSHSHSLLLVCTNDDWDAVDVSVYGKQGDSDDEFRHPVALAALPDGGLVVRELNCEWFQVFRGLAARFAWLAACVAVCRDG